MEQPIDPLREDAQADVAVLTAILAATAHVALATLPTERRGTVLAAIQAETVRALARPEAPLPATLERDRAEAERRVSAWLATLARCAAGRPPSTAGSN